MIKDPLCLFIFLFNDVLLRLRITSVHYWHVIIVLKGQWCTYFPALEYDKKIDGVFFATNVILEIKLSQYITGAQTNAFTIVKIGSWPLGFGWVVGNKAFDWLVS